MSSIITFGDIFNYNEQDYVFLAKTEDIVYAAKILDREHSILYKKIFTKISKNSQRSSELTQRYLYCFIELKTEDFKERVCYYGKSDKSDVSDFLANIFSKLDQEDIRELHKELLTDDLVTEQLKELVKEIELK